MSFKKLVSIDNLVTDKYKFLARWPVRLSAADGGVQRVMDVTGIVDGSCSSPERQATSVGSEQFTFELFNEGKGAFTIAGGPRS
jgi:hypothetical protein